MAFLIYMMSVIYIICIYGVCCGKDMISC